MNGILKTSRLLGLLCLLLAWVPVYAAEPSTGSSKAELERILRDTQRMQGKFTQLVISEGGRRTEPAVGQFWIEKPGKFRWDYTSPYVQQIVSDGESVWFYDPDLEQVTVKPAASDDGVSPLSIIGNERPLDDAFMVQEKGRIDAIDWLELFPIVDQSNYQSIHVGITDGKLVRMVLNDQFGQSTRLLFSGVDNESSIDAGIFTFQAPPGVDVFEDR